MSGMITYWEMNSKYEKKLYIKKPNDKEFHEKMVTLILITYYMTFWLKIRRI